MFRRYSRPAQVALVAVGLVGAVLATGCYRSHRRPEDGTTADAGPPRDSGPRPDLGADAGARCCAQWGFDRRVEVEAFSGEETVTPRLLVVGGELAVVVTGPMDAAGPSGAHLIRLSRDLATQSVPTPVTRGSFTWGQPVSAGDTFAVCAGTDLGNVVTLFDARGRQLAGPAVLDSLAGSPCVDAAYSDGQFAFVYAARGVDRDTFIRARVVDATTLAVGGAFDMADVSAASASIVAADGGFTLAVAGDATRVATFDSDTLAVRASTTLAGSYQVELVDGEVLQLLRVLERPITPTRSEDLWLLDTLTPSTRRPLVAGRELGGFEPSRAVTFDATRDACGTAFLGTTTPSLAHVSPTRLVDQLPDVPSAGPLRGDTSVLVRERDAYVAFTAGTPSSGVQIDRWVCLDE